MTVVTAKVDGFQQPNIIVGGKTFFVPPDKTFIFEKFKEGDSVKLIHTKGTVSGVFYLDEKTPEDEKKKPSKNMTYNDGETALKGKDLDEAAEKAGFTPTGFTPASQLPKATKPMPTASATTKNLPPIVNPPTQPDAQKSQATTPPLAETKKDAPTTQPVSNDPQKASIATPESDKVVARGRLVPRLDGYGKDALITQQSCLSRAIEILNVAAPMKMATESEIIALKDRLFADMWQKSGFPMEEEGTRKKY